MRLIRIGSIGTRSWVMSWQKAVPSREAGEALPFKGRRYKSPPLQGEGEQPSRVVIGRGRVRTIVLVELARQLQRRGVAVAGGQRLEVDRPQRCRSEEHTSELHSLIRISYA